MNKMAGTRDHSNKYGEKKIQILKLKKRHKWFDFMNPAN
jgi:hypothetical protein